MAPHKVPQDADELQADRLLLRQSGSLLAEYFANELERLQRGRELGQISREEYTKQTQDLSAEADDALQPDFEGYVGINEGDYLLIQNNLGGQYRYFGNQPEVADGWYRHVTRILSSALDVTVVRTEALVEPVRELLADARADSITVNAVAGHPNSTAAERAAAMAHPRANSITVNLVARHLNSSATERAAAMADQRADRDTVNAVAGHPDSTPGERAAAMAHRLADSRVVNTVAGHPNSSPAEWAAAMADPRADSLTVTMVAGHPNSTAAERAAAMADPRADKATLVAVVGHPDVTRAELEAVLVHREGCVMINRLAIARSPEVTAVARVEWLFPRGLRPVNAERGLGPDR